MGVEYVEELWTGRAGEDGIERKRSYTRNFEVRTTSPSDDPTVAGGTSLLPRNGDPYPLDSAAYMIKIRPTANDEDPTLWTVSCEYSTELPSAQARESQSIDPETGDSKPSQPENPDGTAPQRAENPLDRDIVWKVSHENYTEAVKFTWQGIEILNCADEPYDPPVEVQRSIAILDVTKNYSIVKFDWLEQFVGAVNATKWNGRRKRTCYIDAINWFPKVENGVSFVEVNYRIKINTNTWDRFLIEQGYNSKSSNTADGKKRIQDPTGAFPDKPTLLDGAMESGVYRYATDDASPVNPNDGSNPAIPGVSYPAATLALDANRGKRGRGQPLANGLPLIYTRWRIFPEKAFSLLGL